MMSIITSNVGHYEHCWYSFTIFVQHNLVFIIFHLGWCFCVVGRVGVAVPPARRGVLAMQPRPPTTENTTARNAPPGMGGRCVQ